MHRPCAVTGERGGCLSSSVFMNSIRQIRKKSLVNQDKKAALVSLKMLVNQLTFF